MKKLHVHIAVTELEESIRFYSALFDTPPMIVHDDYAKWVMDDPRVNFAISRRGASPGLDHMGIQVETAEELEEMHQRLNHAALPVASDIGGSCCYVRADKHWTTDPQGIAWESYHSLKDVPTFNGQPDAANDAQQSACCPEQACGVAEPSAENQQACCA